VAEARLYPDVELRLIHTGQHYDHLMSGAFFGDPEREPVEPEVSARGGSMETAAAAADKDSGPRPHSVPPLSSCVS
jgi:hypothetical protein